MKCSNAIHPFLKMIYLLFIVTLLQSCDAHMDWVVQEKMNHPKTKIKTGKLHFEQMREKIQKYPFPRASDNLGQELTKEVIDLAVKMNRKDLITEWLGAISPEEFPKLYDYLKNIEFPSE